MAFFGTDEEVGIAIGVSADELGSLAFATQHVSAFKHRDIIIFYKYKSDYFGYEQ